MTTRPWPVEHARAWCMATLGDVPIPLANEADFREALRVWCYSTDQVDRFVADVYAAANRDACVIGHGAGNACFHCEPENQPDDVVEHIDPTPCPDCGTMVIVFPEELGVRPDECVDGNYTTHSWLVCQLRSKIDRLIHERDELGRAIAEAAFAGGIYNGYVPCTGPDLILLAKNMGELLASKRDISPDQQAQALDPIDDLLAKLEAEERNADSAGVRAYLSVTTNTIRRLAGREKR